MNGEDNWQPENGGIRQDSIHPQEEHEEGEDENGQGDGTHVADGPTPLQANPNVNDPPKDFTKVPESVTSPEVEKDSEQHGDDETEVEPPQKCDDDDDDDNGEGQDDSLDGSEDDVNVRTSSHANLEKKSSQEDTTEGNLALLDFSIQREDINKDKKHTERTSLIKEEENAREHSVENDLQREAENPNPVKVQDTNIAKYIYSMVAFLVVLVAVWYATSQSPPDQKEVSRLDVFRLELDNVRSSFPNQHGELWRRSKIHIQRHLNKTHPSEPVSIILTSGHGAERTLGCLARRLAAAFSTALNASVLDIDGTSKAEQDSDQVKLDIDRALRDAFEGGKHAAVIHRFEQLPPASTLIFYRYCDHENAAYKNVFLAFTVIVEKGFEFPPNVNLGIVEETVQEFLKEKFVSAERTAMFNRMDVDKLSGLWSRISHLILPVTAEQIIEQQGCVE